MPVVFRVCLLLTLTALIVGAEAPRSMQPEDKLIDPSALRGELLRRGMSDLLQAYLDECPPTGAVEKLVYERQRQLAVYADKSRDEDECLAALDKAIALLAEAIAKYGDDPRAIDWQMELGKDLIYKRAEPYYNNILFRGGSKEDREQLLAITTRATAAFDSLEKTIQRWDQQLQQRSEAELRRLENSGEIARYRTLRLQAGYFANWARFYRALATPPGKDRDAILKDVVTYLTVEKSDWIETEHAESGVQCQSLLLMGMTYRLAGDSAKGAEFLERAVERTSKLDKPADKRDLAWVIWLGKMELVKLARDEGKYDEALAGIQAMTRDMSSGSQSLSVELAAALLEGSIYRKQAEAAAAKKDAKAHDRLMAMSRQPLIALAARRPKAKARIYASLYPLLGKDPDPAKFGPFDKSVYLAGLLNDAGRAQQRLAALREVAKGKLDANQKKQAAQLDAERKTSLGRAVAAGELFLKDASEAAKPLRPEVLYNLATAYFQSGNALEAVDAFARLARDHPDFDRSREAAIYAVEIAADVNRNPAFADRPDVRKAFIASLRVLTGNFAESDEARYWQFFLANSLELEGRDAEAAEAYAKVAPTHENYLDANYYRIGCLERVFETTAASQKVDQAAIRTRAEQLAEQAVACAGLIAKSLEKIEDDARRAELTRQSGDALLTAARLNSEPPLENHKATLDILDGFEDRYGSRRELIGRAMRLRIVAMQDLGQLEQAKNLIPDYVERDPENAGATLSALLSSMRQEVERARQRSQIAQAKKAAAEAVELAKWLYKWSRDNQDRLKPAERFAIRSQLAQAHLEAEQYEQARKLFQQCLEEDAARSPDKEPTHGPTILGLAESHYQLGQQAAKAGRFDQATESLTAASRQFLAVWRRAERGTPIWWQALLRGLESPLALREITVARLGSAKRQLAEQERERLARIPQTLAKIQETINAERMGDPKLGGYASEFLRVERRLGNLRDRLEGLER